MDVKSKNFIPAAAIAVRNEELQASITKGTQTAFNGRLRAMFADGIEHGEAMRQQAAEAKRRALRELPDLLEKAEANLTANGATVLWATDGDEAKRLVIDIARKHDVKMVVKSKSMVTEEIALNAALEANSIQVVETDLGEFIVQVDHDHPSHIVAPIVHKSKAEIRDSFVRELGMEPTEDAYEMTQFARRHLRESFLTADMGVSGGNFIIAETGTVCLVTNEGNGRMVTSLPKVHVALVGIEKIVATVEDYATLTQVLPRSGTGQAMPVYTSMINGPKREEEGDGPEHVYVILLDNGRSDIYATDYSEALACIRCGACLNACPVYQVAGGHAYGWVYPGPIGAVISPLLKGLNQTSPLPHASSLCGMCKQVCPVDIDLPRMLLDLRHDIAQEGHDELKWRWGIRIWALVNQSPRLFGLAGRLSRFGRNRLLRQRLPGPLGNWTKYRDFPQFADKSFHQQWKERQKNG